jgi:hypothetical protein
VKLVAVNANVAVRPAPAAGKLKVSISMRAMTIGPLILASIAQAVRGQAAIKPSETSAFASLDIRN